MPPPSISLAIPAYNEQGNIEASVDSAIRGLGNRFSSYEIIIVNDGSHDDTGKIIDRLAKSNPNVKAIHHPVNKGMGKSLSTGFQAATKEYVGSFPGDNGLEVESWGTMLDLIGKADIVSYCIGNPEFRPWRRRFVSWAFVTAVNMRFGLSIKYFNGHAVYKREAIQSITHLTNGHTFLAECMIRLLRKGYSHCEIPTIQIERKTGETKAFSGKNFRDLFTFFITLPMELNREKSNRK